MRIDTFLFCLTLTAGFFPFFSATAFCTGPGVACDTLPGSSGHRKVLKGVAVTGKRSPAGSFSPVVTLDSGELQKLKGSTLAEITRTVPGVTMLQTGATIAKPVIHGMHSNRLLILNNGIRQEGQQWGSEHAPGIDPFMAGRVSVIKGTETIRFGAGALGGVILVEPPALPGTPEIRGAVNLAGSSNGRSGASSGMLTGGIRGLPGAGWRVQGTLRQAGNIRTADYYLENTGIKELGFSAEAGYSRKNLTTELYFSHFQTSLGIFRGAHIGNLSDLEARIANGRPLSDGTFSYGIDVPRQEVSHDLLKLKGAFRFSGRSELTLQYSIQSDHRKEYDIRRGGRNAVPSMDLVLTTQTLDAFLEKYTGKHWKNTLGLQAMAQVNNTQSGTFATPLIPNFDTYNAAAYLLRKFLHRDYELEAGLRYDYNYQDALGYDRNQDFYGGTRQFHHVSASAGGLWRISSGWELRSNFALGWRPPAMNERYSNGLHHGTASYELGDAGLESEQSFKWITGLNYESSRWQTGLTVYVHRFRNYIYLKPALEYVTTMQGAFPTFRYEQTHARFVGTDVFGSYLIARALRLEVKGSLLRAKDVSHGRYLPWIAPDRMTGTLRWELPSGRQVRNTYLQLQHEYTARQNRYEPESDFAPPPPAYHLWHLGAGTKWNRGKDTFSFHLSVNNLTGVLYREYMNRFRYYAHDRGRNITLRIAYEF